MPAVDYSEVFSLGYSYTFLVYSSAEYERDLFVEWTETEVCDLFFYLRVINYHVDLCTAAAVHFYFKSTAVQHGPHWVPQAPNSLPTF